MFDTETLINEMKAAANLAASSDLDEAARYIKEVWVPAHEEELELERTFRRMDEVSEAFPSQQATKVADDLFDAAFRWRPGGTPR